MGLNSSHPSLLNNEVHQTWTLKVPNSIHLRNEKHTHDEMESEIPML